MILGPRGTLIVHRNFRFVITHLPHVCSMSNFVEDLLQYDTKMLVRVCSGHYDINPLRVAEVPVVEMMFPDGTFPEEVLINKWISMVEEHFENYPLSAIAVHCKSGLGRSAVLVAIALIEAGMLGKDAIELIREKRTGTFNTAQRDAILAYKSQNRLFTAEKDQFTSTTSINNMYKDKILSGLTSVKKMKGKAESAGSTSPKKMKNKGQSTIRFK